LVSIVYLKLLTNPSDAGGGLTWPMMQHRCHRWRFAVAKGSNPSSLHVLLKFALCRSQLYNSHLATLATAMCVICNVKMQVFCVSVSNVI